MIRITLLAALISFSASLSFAAPAPKGYLVPKDTFAPWQQGSPTMNVSAKAGGKTRELKSTELATQDCAGEENCLAVYQTSTRAGKTFYQVKTAAGKRVWIASELFSFKPGAAID
ncbi:MAG TPA: hypothetical protein VFV50_05045 [Bdellovibrionales bacterium]|nr:hypothetical protein [Bdellovibrionales bacterium]